MRCSRAAVAAHGFVSVEGWCWHCTSQRDLWCLCVFVCGHTYAEFVCDALRIGGLYIRLLTVAFFAQMISANHLSAQFEYVLASISKPK